ETAAGWIPGSPVFNQFRNLAEQVGGVVTTHVGDFSIKPLDALSTAYADSVVRADTLIQDAVRSEWDVYRAGLAGRAEKFQAASWLYAQFAAGSLPEQQAFMATVDDLAIART